MDEVVVWTTGVMLDVLHALTASLLSDCIFMGLGCLWPMNSRIIDMNIASCAA